MNRNGFTLIELMIVVVVIGVLAALAIPRFAGVSQSAKEAESVSILKQLYTLQMRYQQKHDTYAPTLASLEGGEETTSGAKYYQFSLTSDGASVFCASASQKQDLGNSIVVSPRSIDQDRNIYSEAECTGAVLDGPAGS